MTIELSPAFLPASRRRQAATAGWLKAFAAFVEGRILDREKCLNVEGIGVVRAGQSTGGVDIEVVVACESVDNPTIRYEASLEVNGSPPRIRCVVETVELLRFTLGGKRARDIDRSYGHLERLMLLRELPREEVLRLSCPVCAKTLELELYTALHEWSCHCPEVREHFGAFGHLHPDQLGASPWLKDFEVRKPERCPRCGSTQIADIVYGFPNFKNPALRLSLEERRILLGGCIVSSDQPRWACVPCTAAKRGIEFEQREAERARYVLEKAQEQAQLAERGCGLHGACPCCGFAYAFDGVRCTHCDPGT